MRYLQKLLEREGVETIWWDLGEKPLPIAVPEYFISPLHNPDKQVRAFNRAIKEADGFILASPLYHGSYSGVLKNAIDNLPSDAFLHKPIGLVSHSSNARSCIVPCNDLRSVVRSLGGYATHHQIGTTDKDYDFTSHKPRLVNPKIQARAQELVDEVIAMSAVLRVKFRDMKDYNFHTLITEL